MYNKGRLLQLLALTATISAICVTAVASRFATAQDSPSQNPPPSQPSLIDGGVPVPPLIAPSEVENYVVLQPGQKITGRLGLPAAQLINPPAELAQEIAVWVPEELPKGMNSVPSPAPGEISYEVISSTRYRGNNHTIYVSTARPSPAAAKLKLDFGKRDKLADGTEAGVVVGCDAVDTKTTAGYACVAGGDTPNRVQFRRGNLIITVASDLPIEQVKNLARNASLQ